MTETNLKTPPKPAPDMNARLDNLTFDQFIAVCEVGTAENHAMNCEQGRVKACLELVAKRVSNKTPKDVVISRHNTEIAGLLRRLGMEMREHHPKTTAYDVLIHLQKRLALTQASNLVWSLAMERMAALGHKKGWLDDDGKIVTPTPPQ